LWNRQFRNILKHLSSRSFFFIKQVWTQKCAVQKASVDVNISYY
jgi:hypothetical protein